MEVNCLSNGTSPTIRHRTDDRTRLKRTWLHQHGALRHVHTNAGKLGTRINERRDFPYPQPHFNQQWRIPRPHSKSIQSNQRPRLGCRLTTRRWSMSCRPSTSRTVPPQVARLTTYPTQRYRGPRPHRSRSHSVSRRRLDTGRHPNSSINSLPLTRDELSPRSRLLSCISL
jgi:hypothetical protein